MLLDQAQDRQRQRFDAANTAVAIAARADDLGRFTQRRTQSLARQLEQAELGNPAELNPGTIQLQRFPQLVFDIALVPARFHVDEIDHHQATQVAQPQLPRHFGRSLHVGVERGLFDIRALGCPCRIDIDRGQRLGVIDDDRTARGQAYAALVAILDLGLDLEARKQRHGVLVQLDLAQAARHHLLHEVVRLAVYLFAVDQYLADVRTQVVAKGAHDQARFLVDQERRRSRFGGIGDRLPKLQQVVQIPLQLFGVATQPGGTYDQTHAIRYFQVRHSLAQGVAILALDAAGNAAGARTVRHQHHVATGQRDERGQRRTLVAALFLVDLDDHFLAFADHFAHRILAQVGAGREVFARDLLQRQETMTVATVFDECRFQTRFDPGNLSLINIGFFLFLGRKLQVEIVQELAVDDRHAQLFALRGIDQHAFH